MKKCAHGDKIIIRWLTLNFPASAPVKSNRYVSIHVCIVSLPLFSQYCYLIFADFYMNGKDGGGGLL